MKCLDDSDWICFQLYGVERVICSDQIGDNYSRSSNILVSGHLLYTEANALISFRVHWNPIFLLAVKLTIGHMSSTVEDQLSFLLTCAMND